MRKLISIVLALVVALMVSALPADAGSGGRGGGHGGKSGGHGGYSSHGGGHGGSYVRHGGYYSHGGHGGGSVRIGVNLGPGWWGPYPYPYYPYRYDPYYPYYPYYPAVRVIEQPASEIFVESPPPAEEVRYLYYCPEPEGYYPEVGTCPKGWLKVVPPANSPE